MVADRGSDQGNQLPASSVSIAASSSNRTQSRAIRKSPLKVQIREDDSCFIGIE